MDCSIRISAGLCSLTTRRSFSQLTTSFFGSQCQGIRPALLLALPFVRFEFSLIHCSFFTRLIFLNRVVSLDCISSYFSYSIFKFPFSILFQEQKLTDNSLSINFHSWLVGTSGLEPPTSRLSGVRSNHLSYAPISSGGDEEDRTPDPLRARQVLSQLSYTPISGFRICRSHRFWRSSGPSKLNNM